MFVYKHNNNRIRSQIAIEYRSTNYLRNKNTNFLNIAFKFSDLHSHTFQNKKIALELQKQDKKHESTKHDPI